MKHGFSRFRDFFQLQVDIKSKIFTLLIASVILFGAMISFAPVDSYIVFASIESSLSTGSLSSNRDVIISSSSPSSSPSTGDFIFTSSSSTPDSAPTTTAFTVKLLPGSSPHFFKCNETPNEGSSTLPGTSDITSSSTIAVTDKNPDTEILGKALFEITFSQPVINNPASPDIIVSEIGDSPESFKVAALNENDGPVSEFKEYSGSPTGTTDSCGYEIFETQIELSDFNVTEGDSIDTLRVDNNGQPGCCTGADIGDIWITSGGVDADDSIQPFVEPESVRTLVPDNATLATAPGQSQQSQQEQQQQQQPQPQTQPPTQAQTQTSPTQSANNAVPGSPKVFNLIVGDKPYPIRYTILGGEIANIVAQSTGLGITFDPSASPTAGSSSSGSTTGILLTIDLPRALIDSTDVLQGGVDKPFVVLSGNGQVIDTVMETEKNATSRTLVISFNNSADNRGSLQIQGTKIALPSTPPPPPPLQQQQSTTTPTTPTTPPAPPTTPTTPSAPPTTPTTPSAPPTTPTTPPAPPTTPTTPPAPPTTRSDLDDDDYDGVANSKDNCISYPNKVQTDTDRDGVGDECDPDLIDSDIDGLVDAKDNCPEHKNDQKDTDGDGKGDACDPDLLDSDKDGIMDSRDNCPKTPNDKNPADSDGDGVGDACDPDQLDSDKDGIVDSKDICPTVPNDKNRNDTDGDGKGDACDPDLFDTDKDRVADSKDNCLFISNTDQTDTDRDGVGDPCDSDLIDSDKDGFLDSKDNCVFISNTDQTDTDRDGVGDTCDREQPDPDQLDVDGDKVVNSKDNCVSTSNPDQKDTDADGLGDACDTTPGNAVAPALAPTTDEIQTLDSDVDGIIDVEDNCPSVVNEDQQDSNGNDVGDACDQEEEVLPVPPEEGGEEDAPPPDEPEPEQPEQEEQDEGDGDEPEDT